MDASSPNPPRDVGAGGMVRGRGSGRKGGLDSRAAKARCIDASKAAIKGSKERRIRAAKGRQACQITGSNSVRAGRRTKQPLAPLDRKEDARDLPPKGQIRGPMRTPGRGALNGGERTFCRVWCWTRGAGRLAGSRHLPVSEK